MTIIELLALYKDVGVAVLFLALLLIVSLYFYRELKAAKKESVAMTERVISALDTSSHATEDCTKSMASLKTTVDENMSQTREFIAFLRGRDASNGGRRL